MAEGGEFTHDDQDLDYKLDYEQEVNTKRPFQPGAVSTPYHKGEQIEMQTVQHEQSRLPETYEETALLGSFIHQDDKPAMLERAKEFIRKRFPSFSKKGNKTEIVSFGQRGGESKIFKSDGLELLKNFTEKVSEALGPGAEEIIAEDRDTIRDQNQRLKEAQKELKEVEKLIRVARD